MNHQITFLVFTFNEQRRLEPFLRCIHGWGRIVVIDNHSSDDTRAIAARYTDEIHTFKNPGYIENKEVMDFALGKVNTPWAYLGYVDELLPHPLLQRLTEIASDDRYSIVELYRKNFMYGQEVFNYGKHHLRLFRPDAVDFTDNVVHKLGKFLVPSSRILQLPANDDYSLWHFSSYNTARLELAHSRYADLEALQRHQITGQKFSGVRAILKFVFYFIGTYFFLGRCRGGWPGFFISVEIAYYKFSIEARLWEFDNNVTPDSIEENYNIIKSGLLDSQSGTKREVK